MKRVLFGLAILFAQVGFGESMDVKLKDVPATDTNISIQKGSGQCVEYEIVHGNEDLASTPEYDRSKAYATWKAACDEWKKSMRELNKENRIISLSCGNPARSQDGELNLYRSNGLYRVRVQMKERR